MMYWLRSYETQTPGVEAYDNATTIIGDNSEPQPDASLIISPDSGGPMRFTEDEYLQGAPEFVGEIASSTESIDLHGKKLDCQRAGVKEYMVVALRQQRVYCFVNRWGIFEDASCEPDGLYRSLSFPGLWLDPVAFLPLDGQRLSQALGLGLATRDHADFAKLLDGPPS